MKRDKTILGVKELADRVMDEFKQFIQIRCYIDALDDLIDDFALCLHPLALSDVTDDAGENPLAIRKEFAK